MQGYIFLPWREVSIGGKQTRRRLEKMIIYQFPATLNVEFHRNQHGLSDTREVLAVDALARLRAVAPLPGEAAPGHRRWAPAGR